MEHGYEILRLILETAAICFSSALVSIRAARKDRRQYHAEMEQTFDLLLNVMNQYQSKLLECKSELLEKISELLLYKKHPKSHTND